MAQNHAAWSALQLWEIVFIGQHGDSAFQSFLKGEVQNLENQIRDSLEVVVGYKEFANPDAGAIAWDEANAKIIDGEAAFIHQGDWAAGQYGAADFDYGDDWDYVAFPGTEEVYSLVMDSFVMPEPNPTPEITENFLSYCGTVDAQERFNPRKGSIPPRTDVPTDEFPPFLQDQMDDFQASNAQPPTIAHGSGLEPEKKSELEEIFSEFIEQWDAEATTNEIVTRL
jgi:glucose/mannose transport system substrate-binding protein